MLEIRETSAYASWFASLRDRAAKARIDIRIRRLSLGSFGDIRPVGEGVSELRSIADPDIASISKRKAMPLLSCLQAATRARKTRIFDLPRILLAISSIYP